jgi:hypothetical protein
MAGEEQIDRIPYQRALRVIGRNLDAEPAYHVSILEVADGFTVRSHQARHRTDGRIVHFKWDRLHDLLIFHTAGRDSARRRHRHQGIWANFPSGHEDFFRALGFTLDTENANSLSVDEVPEGIAVSYMRPTPGNALSYEKCHIVYHKQEIETMLTVAQERRGQDVSAESMG